MNKIYKESNTSQTARNKGVGFSDWLCVVCLFAFCQNNKFIYKVFRVSFIRFFIHRIAFFWMMRRVKNLCIGFICYVIMPIFIIFPCFFESTNALASEAQFKPSSEFIMQKEIFSDYGMGIALADIKTLNCFNKSNAKVTGKLVGLLNLNSFLGCTTAKEIADINTNKRSCDCNDGINIILQIFGALIGILIGVVSIHIIFTHNSVNTWKIFQVLPIYNGKLSMYSFIQQV
ncbi:MAG: hypothetical protein H8D23_09215 [Candidatus Brocadiales bacterium]|nr:hypothetical protein [Candidatus Brocadiales bacterium]